MIRPVKPSEVLSRYKTDKNSGINNGGHNYGQFYDAFLPHYRWTSAVLEIGIFEGASLRAWADYFPDAIVTGIDNVPGRLLNEGRIRSLLVDASDPHQMELFAAEYADHFSVAIDDGSHKLQDQLLAAKVLKKCVKVGGIVVIEDIKDRRHNYLFTDLGYRVEEWDCDRRQDNRLAYYLKTEKLYETEIGLCTGATASVGGTGTVLSEQGTGSAGRQTDCV